MSIYISFYDNHQILYNTIQKIISIIIIILFSVTNSNPTIYDKKIFDYCKPKRKAYMS
jgi:hypothetical protein